ncbi:MAG: hypothetical protein ACTSQI_21115 [Candidatus Helarchaeota archaeon]
MGKKVLKLAKQLGLLGLPLYVLYGRAKKIRMTFSKYVPDVADAIRDFLTLKDENLIQGRSGGGRNNSFYYLSEALQLFVQVVDKASGFVVVNPSNHAIQFNIYTKDEELVRGIAQTINQIWEDGILAHMEWKKIEKKFKVNAEDGIAQWNKWLQ